MRDPGSPTSLLWPKNAEPVAALNESGQSQNPTSTDVADPKELIQKGPGITPPQATYSPGATYTEEARRARLDGDVVLYVTVTETGEVAAVTVVRGLGKGLDMRMGWRQSRNGSSNRG
jgi:outer membrane biosynthesis protein TonB